MDIKLSGSDGLAMLVSGSDSEHLRVATAFGTSMLPFIKPGTDLRIESVHADTICLGDVITFHYHPGVLVTHRVVKIIRRRGQYSFLTKGDNRLNCDPVVLAPQIAGRVILVAKTNIRSLGWIAFGRILAGISYSQMILYHWLARSGLNQFRHHLEEKGLCPKVPLRDWFVAVTYPFNRIASIPGRIALRSRQK